MRYALLLLAALALPCQADDWTSEDSYREAAFAGLMAIDWLQTRSGVVKHPDRYEERNPFLGKQPSLASVNVWFAFGLAVHAGIAAALPQKYRVPFQYVTIGIETGLIARNFRIGVRIEL